MIPLTRDDWQRAELLRSPECTFALYQIAIGLCPNRGAFTHHFGSWDVDPYLLQLQETGYLEQSESEFILTEAGRKAIGTIFDLQAISQSSAQYQSERERAQTRAAPATSLPFSRPSGASDASEPDLLVRARADDSEAFSLLYEHYRVPVWRALSGAAQGGVDHNDLAQETFLRAWNQRKSWRQDVPLLAYLLQIALVVAHTAFRAYNRSSLQTGKGGGPTMPGAAPPPEASAADPVDVRRQLLRALVTMDLRQSVPIHLIYLEDFSVAEVARLQGVAESTVRRRVKAGLQAISQMLDPTLLAALERDEG